MPWKRRVLALLMVAGAWQLGEGMYIHAKAILAQHLLQQAWNRIEQGEGNVKPWDWADTWPLARIRVKRLGVEWIVLAGSNGRTLAFGPGHVNGTALPGSKGNSAISGHRDTHFRFLRKLRDLDRIELDVPGEGIRHYVVKYHAIHHQDDVWLLDDYPDRWLTLITCYPFDAKYPGGPLRYVVMAEGLNLESGAGVLKVI